MWVYQQTGAPAHLPEAAQQLPLGEAALLPQPQKTLPPERSAPEVPSPLQETSHGNPAENLLAARLCLSDRLWLSWRASGSAKSSSRTGCNITCKAGAACLLLQMHILRPAFSEWNILRWLRPRPFCS